MINEKSLNELRAEVKTAKMSEKRRAHTLAVEDTVIRLGELYAPDKLDILRAAALLHDITKELTVEDHADILRSHGIEPTKTELIAEKTLHARTAALLIPEKYGEFSDPEVIAAVRWHTTGHTGMTLTEKLVYLADYIDETRKFSDCVRLRELFWSQNPEKMSGDERIKHLNSVLIASFKMTVAALVEEERPISTDTVDALNELIEEKYN